MNPRTPQSAYDRAHSDAYAAMYRYLTEDLGRDPEFAAHRAQAEVERRGAARFCDELETRGIRIAQQRILDLGAGLGALTAELASRGGIVFGVEPGEGWRRIAAGRLSHLPSAHIVGGVGESLPLGDNSIDLVVSLQVLEHVQSPPRVIREMYRVLKPGGALCIAYENYLGFREPHYGVAWLPMLPKPLGAVYLKLRGRNPRFLLEAVTYTSFPAVRRELLRAGFRCLRQEGWKEKLYSKEECGWRWRILRSIPPRAALRVLAAADFSTRIFRTFTEEMMRKPDSVSDSNLDLTARPTGFSSRVPETSDTRDECIVHGR